MRNEERKCKRLLTIGTATLFLICGLVLTEACTAYNPSFYPSYDVLNPGPEVRENPFGFVFWSEDEQVFIIEWKPGYLPDKTKKYILIDNLMSQWIDELTEELEKRNGD